MYHIMFRYESLTHALTFVLVHEKISHNIAFFVIAHRYIKSHERTSAVSFIR